MHIFIDESGTFASAPDKRNSVSAVGALIVPDHSMKGFEKLYGRLRTRLPKTKGEVKGKTLEERQIAELTGILRKVGAILEIVTIDMATHPEQAILKHKASQEEAITASLTSEHHPNAVHEVWRLRSELEAMSAQLYVQSVVMGELVYHSLNHAGVYFSLRTASELGEYHWVIDAKERKKTTPWEKWWQTVILPMLESKTFRTPFLSIKGGDYRWRERFRTTLSDYKRQFVSNPDNGEIFDLRPVMQEDFRFSPEPELGLEAVDIVTNAVRRAMSGNLSRAGWIELPKLMIHRKEHYIHMVSLAEKIDGSARYPYMRVLNDFRKGGRSLLPPGCHSD